MVAGGLFAATPDVLYLQSTPMSEVLLIACISATTYHLVRWSQTGAYRQLAATAAAMLLGSLTSYRPGCVDLAVIAAIAWVAWRRQPGAGLPARRHRAQADLVFYATLGCSGIAAWLVWNQALFHNALHFQNGSLAGPSLWVSRPEMASGISASPRARTCTRWPTTSAGWRWGSPWPGWSATSRAAVTGPTP